MTKLFKELKEKINQTENPLAIFDLDGTLFDVTYRTAEILKRFIQLPEVVSEYPHLIEKIKNMKISDHKYSLEQTLNSIGIDRYSENSARFLFLAEEFWFKHFFIDELIASDKPYKGAKEIVHWMHDLKIKIVYLSGRDIPNMSRGTLAALEDHGFPVHTSLVSVILKPAYGMDDLIFKKESLNLIRQHGNVIATFDNEPANVKMFAEEFPSALNVHFYTQFARDLDLTHPSVSVIRSFQEIGF